MDKDKRITELEEELAAEQSANIITRELLQSKQDAVAELRFKVRELEVTIKTLTAKKPRLTMSDFRRYMNEYENEQISFSRLKEKIDEHYGGEK